MEDFDQNDSLWILLGQAEPRDASAYFADRTVREALAAGECGDAWSGVAGWWRRLGTVSLGGALAAFAVAAIFSGEVNSPRVALMDPGVEFETIVNLDQLVATNDASLWLENSSSASSF